MTVLADRAERLLHADARAILGVVGSPGAGKTTLAKDLVVELNRRAGSETFAVWLPMDGFHLANATLDRLGRHDRKGAIDTFDGWGVLAILRRLLVERDNSVYAPAFDRATDEPVAGSIEIGPNTRIVVVEGNYLLIDEEPWSGIRPLLAEAWFCETPEPERMKRLIERHVRHGRDLAAATAWARDVDGVNARLIESSRGLADLTVSGIDGSVLAGPR